MIQEVITDSFTLEMLHETGVYKITHLEYPDKFYIGSVSRTNKTKTRHQGFFRRFSEHLSALKRNQHHAKYLQRVVNKYGIEDLRFEILEVCKPSKCLIREQFYLDMLNPSYNTLKKAIPCIGWTHKKAEKKRRSEAAKGKALPEKAYETIRKLVYQFNADGELIASYNSIQEAANKLNIDRGSISNCASGKRPSAGGFKWSFEDTVVIKTKQYIYQYDSLGQFINKFTTLEEIKQHLSLTSSTSIRACINGKQKHAYGFVWIKH